MNPTRVYAFSVVPQRLAEPGVGNQAPVGGSLAIDPVLSSTLDRASEPMARVGTRVDVQVDPTTRTSVVREALLSIVFGDDEVAEKAAAGLASKLAASMDRRSDPCLLVIASETHAPDGEARLWTFPKELAFEFQAGKKSQLKVLKEAFSSQSRLRKAAHFQGKANKVSFLRGHVLDHQSPRQVTADFWMARFLECQFSITSDGGTRMLTKALRACFESAVGLEERERVYGAAIALKSATRQKWSLKDVAEEYLPESTRPKFLAEAPNDSVLADQFDLNPKLFAEGIGLRVFELEKGVQVHAPFDTIGKSVKIQGEGHDVLAVSARILSETMRTKRGPASAKKTQTPKRRSRREG